MQKSASQQPLSCIKEGLGQQSSNKFETSEHFHPIPAFQNGGTEFITKYAPGGRLNVQTGPKKRLLLCFSKKRIKGIMVLVGKDALSVRMSLFWSRSSSSNIYQNFKDTNLFLRKASDSCDNISGKHGTHVTYTRTVINEQIYNNFFLTQMGFAINLKKSILVSVQQTEFLGLETSKKGGRDWWDVSKTNGRQSNLKGYERVTGEIDFYNLSNFISKASDSFTVTDANTDPEKKHEQRICDYSGPAGERGPVMVDNQYENLQWKFSVNSTPITNHISRCIKEGMGSSCQGITTGVQWSSVEKTWYINVLELDAVRLEILSFTKFKKLNLIYLWADNMTTLSYLLNMGGTQSKHFKAIERNLGLSHTEEKTFDSRIYTQSEQSNRRLGIPNIPAQQRMKTLSNCFQTNLQPFRETIIRHVCFQTLPLTAMIDT